MKSNLKVAFFGGGGGGSSMARKYFQIVFDRLADLFNNLVLLDTNGGNLRSYLQEVRALGKTGIKLTTVPMPVLIEPKSKSKERHLHGSGGRPNLAEEAWGQIEQKVEKIVRRFHVVFAFGGLGKGTGHTVLLKLVKLLLKLKIAVFVTVTVPSKDDASYSHKVLEDCDRVIQELLALGVSPCVIDASALVRPEFAGMSSELALSDLDQSAMQTLYYCVGEILAYAYKKLDLADVWNNFVFSGVGRLLFPVSGVLRMPAGADESACAKAIKDAWTSAVKPYYAWGQTLEMGLAVFSGKWDPLMVAEFCKVVRTFNPCLGKPAQQQAIVVDPGFYIFKKEVNSDSTELRFSVLLRTSVPERYQSKAQKRVPLPDWQFLKMRWTVGPVAKTSADVVQAEAPVLGVVAEQAVVAPALEIVQGNDNGNGSGKSPVVVNVPVTLADFLNGEFPDPPPEGFWPPALSVRNALSHLAKKPLSDAWRNRLFNSIKKDTYRLFPSHVVIGREKHFIGSKSLEELRDLLKQQFTLSINPAEVVFISRAIDLLTLFGDRARQLVTEPVEPQDLSVLRRQ